MANPDFDRLLAFFKAMANESRLRIVGLLAARERSVQELAELLALTEPTVSHHLAALKALGLVRVRAEGVTRWHVLDAEALTAMNLALLEPKDVAAMAPPAQDWDAKVVQGFLDPDGRLKVIPASRRKREIVLRWLVDQFDTGRRYQEAEVNEMIQKRHWDSATLRRELIGHGMMAREAGVYWRT
ncbi:MAG TPA: metalloregulator ArsR/SmtB family transcription factor [Phenylobacterium sp.]